MSAEYHQLRMLWPVENLGSPPSLSIPPGYALRTYQPGDETRFYQVMALAGWPGWDDAKLSPWFPRMLTAGWFMLLHEQSRQIVATAMALSDMQEFGETGGELGWVASDLTHAGQGLGRAVSAAATARMIQAGYRHIHLYTEDFRLAAIKTYLKLGYQPYLDLPEMTARWQAVCAQLAWPFTPQRWATQW